MTLPSYWGNGSLQLLALDPGGTTGWATYSADMCVIDDKAEYFREKWNAGQIEGADHHERLYRLLSTFRTQQFAIICESFEYRPSQQHADLIANEYIGIVKYFQQEYEHAHPVVWQTKAYGRGFFKDDKLKTLGRYFTGHKHANDATAHLLQYMTFGPLDRKDILGALK